MKLKNISEKVISIGSTVVMPDADITITKEQADTPAIKVLVKHGFVSVKAETSAAGKAQGTAEPPNPDNGAEQSAEQSAETDSSAGKKANKK